MKELAFDVTKIASLTQKRRLAHFHLVAVAFFLEISKPATGEKGSEHVLKNRGGMAPHPAD